MDTSLIAAAEGVQSLFARPELGDSLLNDSTGIDTLAGDPFQLLEISMASSPSSSTSLSPRFLNIQLLALRKLDRTLSMCLLGRGFAKILSTTNHEKEIEVAADSFHSASLARSSLICWRKHTHTQLGRDRDALKRYAMSQRTRILGSTITSWRRQTAARGALSHAAAAVIKRRVLQQWHRLSQISKCEAVAILSSQRILLETLTKWRLVVFVPSNDNAVDTGTSAITSGIGKENICNSHQPQTICTSTAVAALDLPLAKLRKQRIASTKPRTPRAIVQMRQREIARQERRVKLNQRQTAAQKKRKQAMKEAELSREKARNRRETAEMQRYEDEEMRRKLIREEQRDAARLAVLHRKLNLASKHFRAWKSVLVEKRWDEKKADAFWYDAVLSRSLVGWRLEKDAFQCARDVKAERFVLRRAIRSWRSQTQRVSTILRSRLNVIHIHHSKLMTLQHWAAAYYQVARQSERIERIAWKRGRSSLLRCSLSKWKAASESQKMERELEERVQEKKAEVERWLRTMRRQNLPR